MLLESVYIILKTNTINDKRASFRAIYHNVLKHEWNLPSPDFLEFVILWTALVLMDVLTHHSSFSQYLIAM